MNWMTLQQVFPYLSKVAIPAAQTRDPGAGALSSVELYSSSWLLILLGLPMSHGGAFSSCPGECTKIVTRATPKHGLHKRGRLS